MGKVAPTMGLQQFERRLERLVEGVFAKAFRSGLQPVELGRRLTREMDLQRAVGLRGAIAPNHFTFVLAPDDLERFASIGDGLVRELAAHARDHAKEEHYRFMGPVEVNLVDDPGQRSGTFDVRAELREPPGGLFGRLVLPDGESVTVTDDPVVIGRLSECEVMLDDSHVSRRHAEVRKQGDAFVVVDLKSSNGTRVNGERVTEHVLNEGDEIQVGGTTLRFEAS